MTQGKTPYDTLSPHIRSRLVPLHLRGLDGGVGGSRSFRYAYHQVHLTLFLSCSRYFSPRKAFAANNFASMHTDDGLGWAAGDPLPEGFDFFSARSHLLDIFHFNIFLKKVLRLFKVTDAAFITPPHDILSDLTLEVIQLMLNHNVPVFNRSSFLVVASTNLSLVCAHGGTPVVYA